MDRLACASLSPFECPGYFYDKYLGRSFTGFCINLLTTDELITAALAKLRNEHELSLALVNRLMDLQSELETRASLH